MAKVHFKNHNITIEVEGGTTLADCIARADLVIETPCNGAGTCGKCRVKARGELFPPSSEEREFIGDEKDVRLACYARVEGDVEVELLTRKSSLKTINLGFSVETEVNSGIKKGSAEKVLGIAVDIGTTGVSSYLVDLETGEVLAKTSSLNPQTRFGGDVLTRISYCKNNSNGTKELQEAIIKKINHMIGELLGVKLNRESIYKLVVAGNTTMLHLFLGTDPSSIATAPYRAVFLDKQEVKPIDMGIEINETGVITLIPSVSGYIGADILAGVVATGFERKKGPALFIDIGTNGEIVAIADGIMASTSTAAGPALEGMNIACGSRAEEGAIDSFSIDEDFNVSFTTIGGLEPTGICGSGLIDITASLVKRKIVLKSGKLNTNLDERVKDRLRDNKFYLTEKIFLSQKDIRQIQLAKGAISTGVTMLLEAIGVKPEDVVETVIAGAFGYHINPDCIKGISLIPKTLNSEISFVGNSAIEGARLALINKDMLKKMEDIKEEIRVLELSMEEKFQEYFVRELKF